MDDSGTDATSDAGQSDSDDQQDGTTTDSTTSTTTDTAASGDLGDSGKRALDAERTARRKAERALADADKRLKAIDDEKLSESERLTKAHAESEAQRATLEADVRSLRVENAALAMMGAVGIVDPELALAALNPADIEFDDEGRPKRSSVKKALDDLVKDHPALVATTSTTTSSRQTSVTNGARTGQTFSRSQLKDHEFFKANQDAIMAAQKEGRITDD